MTAIETTETSEAVRPADGQPEDGRMPVWEDELPPRPVRGRLGRLTLALLIIAFAAGSFYVGVVTEKHTLKSTSATTAGRTARAGTSAAGAGAAGAGTQGATGGATVGQVKLIDGTNIYVTDQTGNVVKVATTPASQITVTSTGTAKDVKPGDTVLVTGPTGDDGTVTATAVRDQGAGGAGLGGFGRGGRAAGGGAGAGPAAG